MPEPLGVSGGVERLVYIPGEVPVPPFPDWWKHDAVLASTAALLRKFHDATAGFVTSDDTRWSMELADPEAGDVLCHNDVCPENVVYRNGEAVALLDFDFVAPGRRVYDLAQFAKMCCPMDNEDAAARLGLGDLDPFHRLRVVADSYGLPPGRESLVEAVAVAVDVGDRFVQRHVRAGEPGFVAMWKATGGQQRMDRRRQWLAENHQRLIEAVG